MDANGFKGRIVLSLIDKIIIGSVAALIVLLFNAKYSEYQKVREQKIAVARIQTEVLLQHRGEFIRAMQEYFLLLDKIKYDEKLDPASLIQLTKILNEIEFTVSNLGTIDSLIKKEAAPILTSVENLNSSLRNLYRSRETDFAIVENTIRQGDNKIRKEYEQFLLKLRDMSFRIVRKDMDSI